MAGIRVSLVNLSTVVADADVQDLAAALQVQVHRDFFPAWKIDADVAFAAKGQAPDPESWQLLLLDDSDQADELGRHDLTKDGQPQGKAFLRSDILAKTSWTVTVSHELLEILADPDVIRTATMNVGGEVKTYALEDCDACEDDQFAYKVGANGKEILVSDFVYPAWFNGIHAPGSRRFDHMGHSQSPLQVLAGGYIGVYDPSAGWTQVNERGDRHRKAMAAPIGSRRERRETPIEHWKRSTA